MIQKIVDHYISLCYALEQQYPVLAAHATWGYVLPLRRPRRVAQSSAPLNAMSSLIREYARVALAS
jgi:hypothetical protein